MIDTELPILVPLLFLLIGVIFAVLGYPLYERKISRNFWYGFRTRKTLSSDEIWYSINRVAGKDMMIGGGAIIFPSIALLVLRDRIGDDATVGILLFVTLAATGWLLIHGLVELRRF